MTHTTSNQGQKARYTHKELIAYRERERLFMAEQGQSNFAEEVVSQLNLEG